MIYLYAKAQTMWATRDKGASAVEYGLLVAGIAAVIVAIVFIFGGKISEIFGSTCKAVNSGATCTATTTTPNVPRRESLRATAMAMKVRRPSSTAYCSLGSPR